MSRTRSTLIAAAIAAVALAPSAARASGFNIYEQGAAVLGMAGAGTATVRDPSAVFFNPAAITRLEGLQFSIGATAVMPVTSFAGMDPYPGYGVVEELERTAFVPPTLYVTKKFSDAWALGFGLNSQYGLGTHWRNGSEFTGRYIVTRADLSTINGNLNAAWAATPRLSVAAGINYTMAHLTLENMVPAQLVGGGGATVDVARAELNSGWINGIGWNAAVSFSPTDPIRLGASIRSKISLDAKSGELNFAQLLTGNQAFDASVAAALVPQAVTTSLDLPALYSFGLGWLPTDQWTLEADFNYFTWSVFEETPIDFVDDPARSYVIEQNYEDAWQARFGAERRLPQFAYRFGYYYDQAAAPVESVTPVLPDASRHGVTLGFGFDLGGAKNWTLDLYQLGVFVNRRSTEGLNRDDYEGEYRSFISGTGFNLTRRW